MADYGRDLFDLISRGDEAAVQAYLKRHSRRLHVFLDWANNSFGEVRKNHLLYLLPAVIVFEGDGQECVDMVLKAKEGQHEAFDAIFIDYEMPRMNGPKVLRSLQCTIPIIGVTGNLLSEDRDCFLQSGALRVLNKPFTLAQLGDSLLDLPDRLFD
eukprot:scaffold4252_cov182-Ochromonas_danica.AAC.1